MSGRPHQVRILNQIAASGLARFAGGRYQVGPDVAEPDAIMLRSADLHRQPIAASVLAIGRAGAGTNNIPVADMSARAIPVFKAPGANANAVKELVIAGMLMAARRLPDALGFVRGLDPLHADLETVVEDGKKRFAGYELVGHTLGIAGLGRIGCLVADAALALGMDVIGFDPDITVDAAWSLSSRVRRAGSLEQMLREADFVTLHVPLVDATRHLLDERRLALMKPGAVLLNFSRDAVVDLRAAMAALEAGRPACYVCDFPEAASLAHPRIIALPHLGASTREAEENCAIMVADQLRDYLEDGNVRNSVNFPQASLERATRHRLAIVNANVPNMLGQISTIMAQAGLNIREMLNKSRGELAYTIVDADSEVPGAAIGALESVAGVLRVRYLVGD